MTWRLSGRSPAATSLTLSGWPSPVRSIVLARLYQAGTPAVRALSVAAESVVRRAESVLASRDASDAGQPEAGAVIRAIGTHYQTLTGADGSFRFDSLPPGGISLVAHTHHYDAFAILAGSRRLTLQPGRTHRVDFRAPDAAALRREVCPVGARTSYSRPRPVRGVLRLLMVDSATAVPLPGVRFVVAWPAIMEGGGTDSTIEAYRQAMTDSRGAATFCDLPTGFPLDVSLLGAGGRAHVMMAEVTRNGILGRVVSGRITR